MKNLNTRTSTQSKTSQPQLQICPVMGKRGLRKFHQMAGKLYENDPCWVAPLLVERKDHFSPKNPYFAHAEYRAWIAYREGRPVGRITAQIDQLHLERYQDSTGFFGMLEAENNPETFQALFATAENWLREQGMKNIRGPFNFSINQECGLLVEGFETPPAVMMGHALPYYGQQIEALGFTGVKDLLAYWVNTDCDVPRAMKKVIHRLRDRISIRTLRRKHFDEEMKILRDIFDDSWSDNWGFVPYTDEEFEHMGKSLKQLVHDDYIQIAEVDGEPASMFVLLPNINEVIHDFKGKLSPLNILKLIWRLKISSPKTGRVPLMGIRKKYQNTIMGATLASLTILEAQKAAIKHGIRETEMSWILEDNHRMRGILEGLGGKVYKRYRIYEKALP